MKKVIYTAIVLDCIDQERISLIAPKGWTVYSHHQTIKFGDQELPSNLGQRVEVRLMNIYKHEKCVCISTVAVFDDGTQLKGHITVATDNVPPKFSNEIVGRSDYLDGEDLNCVAHGTIKAFVREGDAPVYWI